jgi:hypothetical protein
MKNLELLLTALILLTISIKAQDRFTPESLFDYTDTTDTYLIDTALVNNTIDRSTDEFILGWNWGSPGLELDEALGMNFLPHSQTPVWECIYPN